MREQATPATTTTTTTTPNLLSLALSLSLPLSLSLSLSFFLSAGHRGHRRDPQALGPPIHPLCLWSGWHWGL